MLKNFFKIAYRNLLRNKGFSFINITGLAIGMASSMLVLIWINNEINFDDFHEKKDRIYEAWNKAEFSGELQCWNVTPKVLASAAQRDLPEVEQAVRVDWGNNYLFTVGEKKLAEKGVTVDSNFLTVFTFPLLKGNPATVLNDMHSIVVTETFAKKLFGNDDPVGKVVTIDNKDNFTVTGVLKDIPKNTRFQFQYLVPWAYLRSTGGDDNYWGNNSTRTYVLLKKNASFASANAKMKTLRIKYDPSEPKWQMFLYPMSKWRLYSSFTNGVEDGGGRIQYVRLFAIVVVIIILIACINFMNLSTARSEKRAREVGIRKVVGAGKRGLITQFIGESVLISFIAGVFAVMIVQLSIPAFSKLINEELSVEYGNIYFWLAFFGFILFTGLLAGSYPAFFLSSFQPVKVLKGTFKKSDALITPRKVLVVLQFTFAIIFITCTIIVKQQILHAQDRETGYNKSNLVYHFLTGDIEKNYPLIKNELLSTGIASSVTKTSAPLTQAWSDSWGFEWEGKDPNDKTDFDRYCADEALGKTAGLQFVQGRDFDLTKYPTDSTGIIINESALKVMKFKNPIGQIVKDNGIDWHVVGVIKDFILQSPYSPTKPMAIEGAKGWFNVIHIKLNSASSTSANLKKAEAVFKKYNPQYPFDYKFIDEEYAAKFDNEKRIATEAGLFAGLTILISCLGLFGLATYMAENRIKEIGIRKVLGASVSSIASLLSGDFLKLVIISIVIAIPVAWWGMNEWLKDYAYRVDIEWWVFIAAGLVALAIALITVSFQAIRAAVANPAKSLRTE